MCYGETEKSFGKLLIIHEINEFSIRNTVNCNGKLSKMRRRLTKTFQRQIFGRVTKGNVTNLYLIKVKSEKARISTTNWSFM